MAKAEELEKLFRSPKITLSRGKEQLRDFNQKFAQFLEANIETRYQTDPGGMETLQVRSKAPLPEDVGAVLDSAATSIRRALDQATVALARLDGQQDDARDSKLFFPLPADLNAKVNDLKRLSKLLGKGAYDIIERHCFTADAEPELAFLKWLSNRGHRDALQVALDPGGVGFNANGGIVMGVLGGQVELDQWHTMIVFAPRGALSSFNLKPYARFTIPPDDGDRHASRRLGAAGERAERLIAEVEADASQL